ncbi:glutamine synthetase beta-grasp domain-containing protein [bacterium]|nr:glutamine synthetase beta-grasp domain-containing protein [bacterium]
MGHITEATTRLRTTSTPDEFIRLLHEMGVAMLDLRFADLPGRWHHVTVPVAALTASTLEDGVGFDGSSVPGFKTVERGDMVLIPDRTTANLDAFAEEPTVLAICTVAEADTRQPFERDPRVIAARAEAVLRDSGHADTSLWSPELEFYIFTSVDYDEGDAGSYYAVESLEAGWSDSDERTSPGYRIAPGRGYHAIPPTDMTWDMRNEMTVLMLDSGIPVKYHHHENGAAGQVEIEVFHEPLLAAADNLLLGKYIVRNTADAWGAAATFMPKPLATESGNGMHFHVKLQRDGKPIFYDEAGYAGLSQQALHFIGGILEHGRALTAVTNPSTNSYRRLRPGFEAPTNLFFSAANRSAAIRIPAYATEPHAKAI